MLSRPHILVVDDDPLICQQLERVFTPDGYNVTVATHAEQALQVLEDEYIDLVVTDIRLPGLNAVEVLKVGASDYIVKPFGVAAIQESTRLVLEKAGFFTEIHKLRRELKDNYVFGRMLSRSPEMHQVFETIRTVASTDATVVVEGETGTGKELVASTIHHQSARRDGPFVTINCGGLPESLLEGELFGHERGAFTGADQPRLGKIELAHRGTLFL